VGRIRALTMEFRWSTIDWFIECLGMSDASMGSFNADGRWWMRHGTPGATLGAFPLDGGEPASLEDVLFLANCLAFDHDLPIMVAPSRDNPASHAPLIAPIAPEPGQDPGRFYWSGLGEALGMAAAMRVGAGSVYLRYDENHEHLAQFSERFADRLEPLGLYAMAARQVDALTEYLCLWRVLEWGDATNGKAFAEGHLGDLAAHAFGDCLVLDTSHRTVDAFETYRTRALSRISSLRTAGKTDADIAAHLYANRNAIAHGRVGTLLHDFGDSMAGLGADLPIVKLLARMVVEGA
jgi:hypothetical protein